jgi:RNA recognition motif-containing protein
MADAAAEKAAIDDLQNVEWMGRAIRVNKAEPRGSGGGGPRRNDDRAGSFGGGGGYNGGGYGRGKRS